MHMIHTGTCVILVTRHRVQVNYNYIAISFLLIFREHITCPVNVFVYFQEFKIGNVQFMLRILKCAEGININHVFG